MYSGDECIRRRERLMLAFKEKRKKSDLKLVQNTIKQNLFEDLGIEILEETMKWYNATRGYFYD